MLHQPFYDPTKTYEDNYLNGPFGAFTDGKAYEDEGEPQSNFLDHKVFLPFGIPAGTLINSKYIKAAFEKGFDVCVYKTVRSDFYPCHPFPNILAVKIDGDLTLEKARGNLQADTNYQQPLSITNSFGVPSQKPEVWQSDVKKALNYAKKGQLLILSFMGTVNANQSQQEFINDFELAAKLSKNTGAKVLEVNLSCPNIGNEGLVCYDLELSKKICHAIRNVIGTTPLIIKVGYYKNQEDLEKLAKIVDKYADCISVINTIAATIVDKNGNQALPGKNREKSGVGGYALKWAGIEMIERLSSIKQKRDFKFSIIGVGGVTNPKDYFDYKAAGADCVMSSAGSMWNPYLAQEIKAELKKRAE